MRRERSSTRKIWEQRSFSGVRVELMGEAAIGQGSTSPMQHRAVLILRPCGNRGERIEEVQSDVHVLRRARSSVASPCLELFRSSQSHPFYSVCRSTILLIRTQSVQQRKSRVRFLHLTLPRKTARAKQLTNLRVCRIKR